VSKVTNNTFGEESAALVAKVGPDLDKVKTIETAAKAYIGLELRRK
jgi:hypothetical protein